VSSPLNITSKSLAINELTAIGAHSPAKSNEDVEIINAFRKNIQYFPSGLGQLFPNLIGISMYGNGLKELNQDDLRAFSKLSTLNLEKNEIEILEDGIFDNNPDLAIIDLDSNKLVHIDNNAFKGLKNLKFLGLNLNPCIINSRNSTSSIQEVISTVGYHCSNSEFLNLKDLEADFKKVTSKTQSEFKDKFEKLETKFQNSSLIKITGIRQRVEALSEWKSQSLWILKEQLKSLENSNAEMMKIIKEQNAEIDNMSVKYTWMLAVSIFSGFILIIILVVVRNKLSA